MSKLLVKRPKPKDFVLVYSLGDEMYKWCRPAQLRDFKANKHNNMYIYVCMYIYIYI